MAVTEADWQWIDLIPPRVAFCHTWAIKRQRTAVEINRVPGNNAPTDSIKAQALHDRGMLGEAAGMLYFTRAINANVTWHLFKPNGELNDPDIEDFIDVKAARLNSHNLLVQSSGHPDWAYVLALCELAPRIALAGWCWGREAMDQRYWCDPGTGRPAYLIKPSYNFFKPMSALARELTQRRQFKI